MAKAAKASKQGSGATPAIAALIAAGVRHTVHPYDHDPTTELGYGLEAAAALGVEPACVFKTLCVDVDGDLVMAVVPVDAKVDLKAVAAAVGAKKAAMAQPRDAERATGYVVGGISPLGGRTRLPVVVDESAVDHAAMYVSGGRRGLDIGLAPAHLIAVTGALIAPIARRDS